jgi:hypothetical protein
MRRSGVSPMAHLSELKMQAWAENENRIVSVMEWKKYKRGQLVSCSHGFYFIERRFDYAQGNHRWFVEYDPGVRTGRFGKAKRIGSIKGYKSLEATKAYCEQAAQDL